MLIAEIHGTSSMGDATWQQTDVQVAGIALVGSMHTAEVRSGGNNISS